MTGAACPLPLSPRGTVQMAHGGGGKVMNDLIARLFLTAFNSRELGRRHDGAIVEMGGARLAFTTDSYVVSPLFFPGGDIGKLAVFGTVNDLAMCGARPLFLSSSWILEEGLDLEVAEKVALSMAAAAKEAGVEIVTGDTKVVDKGKGDGLYLNTAGVGAIETRERIGPAAVREGDALLVSGDLGRHGVAILSVREGLEFETAIESDCASVAGTVLELAGAGVRLHCLRDLTRGGLGSALNELAEGGCLDFLVEELAVPVSEQVQGACEILGLNPFYVANEGRFIALVPEAEAERALEVMRRGPGGAHAARIGRVRAGSGRVILQSRTGVPRLLEYPRGEQLPRIC